MTTPFGLSLSDSGVVDFVKGYPVSNSSTLAWAWFSSTIIFQRTKPLKPVANQGWVSYGDDTLLPSSLVLALNPKYAPPSDAAVKPGFGLDFSLNQGLLRFTDSTVSLGMNLSLALGKGFTLSFSSLSQNRNFWRYWPQIFPAVYQIGDPEYYRIDILQDLVKSISFWDSVGRTQGQFKLKNLAMKLNQDLEDWNFSFEASAVPLLDSIQKLYIIDPKITISIAWKDIPEIKSAVSYQSKVITY
jgi:hypothetical protein